MKPGAWGGGRRDVDVLSFWNIPFPSTPVGAPSACEVLTCCPGRGQSLPSRVRVEQNYARWPRWPPAPLLVVQRVAELSRASVSVRWSWWHLLPGCATRASEGWWCVDSDSQSPSLPLSSNRSLARGRSGGRSGYLAPTSVSTGNS